MLKGDLKMISMVLIVISVVVVVWLFWYKKKRNNISCEDNTDDSENKSLHLSSDKRGQLSHEAKKGIIGTDCIVSIVMSIISFVLTTIIRFKVQERMLVAGYSATYEMVVPSTAKPFVLIVPIIFTLLALIKTVMSSSMNKKEKAVSYIIAAFSLAVSVAITAWRYRA